MSTNNRIGRNPFDKANKASKAAMTEAPVEKSMAATKAHRSPTAQKPVAAAKTEKTASSDSSKKVLKTSNKKAKQDSQLAFTIQEASTPQKSPTIEKIAPDQTSAATPGASTDQPNHDQIHTAQIHEEQIIGELIDLPEENWQPLTAAPAGFIKQLFARWL